MNEFAAYFLKALISALAGVGVMEWLKNFIKTDSFGLHFHPCFRIFPRKEWNAVIFCSCGYKYRTHNPLDVLCGHKTYYQIRKGAILRNIQQFKQGKRTSLQTSP